MSGRARDRAEGPGRDAASDVLRRFEEAWASPGAPDRAGPLVVAVSGGLDSCVLLHLLRFAAVGPERPLVAAHFDHRMREGSEADGRWVRGLCSAWSVPFVAGAADAPLRSEAEARAARYGFLASVAREHGAAALVTAHHADDQAETVLFRILRGTGPAGIRGIQAGRADGVWRPLHAAWRQEIEAYARAEGLAWREDPTNAALDFSRNVLRHRVLPEVERRVAPGARRSLVRLAALAEHEEEGWESLMPGLVDSLGAVTGPEGLSVDRAAVAALHPAVRARVLRALVEPLGSHLGSRLTALAVAFVESAASGRSLDLGGGVVLRRDLDRLRFLRASGETPASRDGSPGAAEALIIEGPAAGDGRVVVGGRSLWVGWGAPARRGDSVERFRASSLRFPLVVRGWEDGDRIRTPGGLRKVKRVFLEARVPAPERRRLPVLADAEGEVLWIPGVARSRTALPGAADPSVDALPIGVS